MVSLEQSAKQAEQQAVMFAMEETGCQGDKSKGRGGKSGSGGEQSPAGGKAPDRNDHLYHQPDSFPLGIASSHLILIVIRGM
jgi:hypothetical protein